ncbi:MAG TPA: LacI family DNA-binding transcriptional regulator, partial [Armatimonadota bacterium]
MTTVRELAKLAGVAIGTVSRALNNAPDINPGTRARILELVTRFQYRSNRAVPASGVLTIGCLVPRISSEFFARILAGVVRAAFQESCHVIPLETNSDIAITRLALSTLVEQRVAGIMLATGHAELVPKEDIVRVWSAGIVPVCLNMSRAKVPLDTVQTDWAANAELAVNHFLALGHRHMLAFTHSALESTIAFQQRLLSLGLPVLSLHEAWLTLPLAEQFQHILAMKPRPTALITDTCEGAVLLVAEAIRCGLHVPDDLSVLAPFDTPRW